MNYTSGVIRLRYETPLTWVRVVEDDLDAFLRDHASNEHRVSRAAVTLAVQHSERTELVRAMVDVSLEELTHFKQVFDLLEARGAGLGQEFPDPYMRARRKKLTHPDRDVWLLRRLVLYGVIERRGYERFAMLAEHLSDPGLRAFYVELARSEARHYALYLRLARVYFDGAEVDALLDEVLDLEAEIIGALPLKPALH